MSFINDKLYNGYLRQNMGAIVSKVKVREIIIHLPCLTPHDQETIEAKREMCGNYNSMVLLLDCLKRRENWPQQFIDALEACEQTTLAAEIRAEYNMLRGSNSKSSGQAAVAPPAELDARASAPLETPVQPQVPEAVSPPEPVPEPPQSTQVEVAPGQLISINPPNNGSPTVVAPSAPVQPYSGDSGRLEVSDSVPDTVTSTQPPSCSAFSSTTVSTASALPCQENGISLNHNEPEENHYESPCRGLEMHRVLTHVVHVSEEPSILDLDGQSPKQARFYNVIEMFVCSLV
uniref:Mitochondrial antiviral-signaling protein n=1 Tax=Cyclopterus lumpus TaxID=8103 RepID=A0A8C2ZS60_CYCLU